MHAPSPAWVMVGLAIALLAPLTSQAELATESEATQVCRNWLAYHLHHGGTWAGSRHPEILGVQSLRSDETHLAWCFAIAPRGFIVVPALKALPPVKAHSEASDLDPTRAEGFPRLLRESLGIATTAFRTHYGSLEAIVPSQGEPLIDPRFRRNWDIFAADTEDFTAQLGRDGVLSRTSVGPLLTTMWHQLEPYNNFCPMGDGGRCVVGCASTATAQIMRYHEWPPMGGSGSHTYEWLGDFSCGGFTEGGLLSANFEDPYDWASMPDHCDSGCTGVEQNALAELCYEVGVSLETLYGACGSAGRSPDEALVSYFGYDPSLETLCRCDHTMAGWFGIVQEEINDDRPMWYVFVFSETTGHAVVCDGWADEGGVWMYHINYGCGGAFSAWFAIDEIYHCLDPQQDQLLRGIMPAVGPYPCCLGLDCVDLTWEDCLASGGVWAAGATPSCNSDVCEDVVDQQVCCIGPECVILTEYDCLAAGGEWWGSLAVCTEYTCDPRSACCVGEVCETLTQSDCAAAGGEWREGSPCYPSNPCVLDRFACCVAEACQVLTEAECGGIGGTWMEGRETCDPSPCGSDLSAGMLLVHAPPGLEWTSGQNWCERYNSEFALANLDEQVSRIDPDIAAEEASIWYVIMAWSEPKQVCGLEFGLGEYEPGIFGFTEWGACASGGLEVPMTDWPDTGRGTAVAPEEAWEGAISAVYWFTGYSYMEGEIPLGVHPTTGAVRFHNCAHPCQTWGASCLGSLGVLTEGIPCYDGPGPVRVCCVGDECTLLAREACEAAGGSWRQLAATCDPNPCAVSPVDEMETQVGRTLLAAAPNPFAGSVTLHFHVAVAGPIAIDVFDVSGRLVRRLASGLVEAGWHSVCWDGTTDQGNPVGAGTYPCRLRSGSGGVTRRLIRLE